MLVTKASVDIQVVGGLCDKELGKSTIEVAVDGSCEWKTTMVR